MGTDMETKVRQIPEKHRQGYNCAQSTLCAFADELGIDEEILFRVAEGFGAGMGGMMETCGAVTAMFMAAGLKNSCADLSACNTKPQTMKLVREMAEAFRQKNGSIVCRELKGVESGTVLRDCDGCIEDAVRILGEKLFGIS